VKSRIDHGGSDRSDGYHAVQLEVNSGWLDKFTSVARDICKVSWMLEAAGTPTFERDPDN